MALAQDELAMLRETTRSWIEDNAPVARFRALRNAGQTSDAVARTGLQELGWGEALTGEALGGQDLGMSAAVVLAEECGRQLVAVPLAQGLVGAALALNLAGERADPAAVLALDSVVPTRLAKADQAGGLTLSGSLQFVPGIDAASRVLVPAGSGGEVRLVSIPASSLAASPRRLVDSLAYATLDFAAADLTGTTVLPRAITPEAFAWLLDCVLVAAAAEMLGAAQRAFEITVDYLKVREQFGKRIGSFQALQHRASHMLCQLETLRAVIEAAALAADERSPDLSRLAAMAKALAGETSRLVMAESLQFHGGIGMTEEHDIGLYFKRGRVTEFLLGDGLWHRRRYADLCGL